MTAPPPPATSAGRSRSRFWFAALALLLAAIALLPVWTFRYMPTQDGPAHLYNASVIAWYDEWPAVRDYFIFRPGAAGNAASQAILALLLPLTGPVLAEKLLITFLILLFPAGMYLLLRAVGSQNMEFALWGLALVKSTVFYLGFWNFTLGTGLMPVALAVAVRQGTRPAPSGVVWLAVLSGALYSCHMLAWAAAAGSALAWWAWSHVLERRAAALRTLPRMIRERLPATVALLWPALLLWIYVTTSEKLVPGPPVPMRNKLWGFYSGAFLGGALEETALLRHLVMLFAAAMVVLALFWRWRGGLRAERSDVLLLICAASCVVLGVSPGRLGSGGFLTTRFAWITALLLFLWLGGQRWPGWVRAVSMACCLAALTLQSWTGYGIARRWQPVMLELSEVGEQVPDGAVVLTAQVSRDYRDGLDPVMHMAGRWAPKHFVDLRHFVAFTPHFPVGFRPEYSPSRALGRVRELESAPARFSISRYESLRRGRVDVVVVYGVQANGILEDLPQSTWDPRQEFELAAVSRPRGLAYVYRRRDPANHP